jgi:hypothetical integral membrane protein (TIGR02206 family)
MRVLAIQLFGPAHLGVLAVTLLAAALLIIAARTCRNKAVADVLAYLLATILIINKIVGYCVASAQGRIASWHEALPMHMCDWVTIVAVLALIWRWQATYEMAYFWSLAGTLQALLTPDLAAEFPNVLAFTFFISHGGAIVAVLYLTFALRMRPWPRSIVRVFLWSNVYLAAAGLVDLCLKENYGYLRHKPVHASLLDHLGPWPVYLISMELLALLSFAIYYTPFFVADKVRERRAARASIADRKIE